MKKLFALFLMLGLAISDVRAAAYIAATADWEAITGGRFAEYEMRFGRDESMGEKGLELYWLDGFPCMGETGNVFTWIAPAKKFDWDDRADKIRVACVFPPAEVRFAFREAREKEPEGRATGFLVCRPEVITGRQISIKLEDCNEVPFK